MRESRCLQGPREAGAQADTGVPRPHLPSLLGVLIQGGDIPGMLVWSQLTCVIRPGLAPVPEQAKSKEPCLCPMPALCPPSTRVPVGYEWEVFPTLCSHIWSDSFLKGLLEEALRCGGPWELSP